MSSPRPTTDYEFNVYPNETVKQLKVRLAPVVGLPWALQRVVYAGQQYNNDVMCSVVLARGRYGSGTGGMYNNRADRVSLYIVRYNPVPGQSLPTASAGGKIDDRPSGRVKLKSSPSNDHYSSKLPDKPCATADSGPETKESTLQEHMSCFDAYRDALRRQGYGIVSCHGDGNCLFRSISHQVYGTESHHLMVRRKCVEYMSHNADHFSPSCEALRGSSGSFASYLQIMAKDARDVGERAWGDYPEIGACAEIYGRRIEIWTYDSVNDGAHVQEHCKFGAGFDRDASSTNESTNLRPIRLSFFKGGHYDSIVDDDAWVPISTAPGRVENGAIALAKTRAPGQLNAAIQASREQAMQFGRTGTVGMDQVIVRHVMRDGERQHVEESLLKKFNEPHRNRFDWNNNGLRGHGEPSC